MGCPPLANFLQILINFHKPLPQIFAFGQAGDATTDISLPVTLYRKMCVVTVKRWQAFQHAMLYMKIHFWFEVKWSGVTVNFLGTKVLCTLGWTYSECTWLYCDYFIWCVSCNVVHVTCFVILECMCGFCNVWVCVYVWVL